MNLSSRYFGILILLLTMPIILFGQDEYGKFEWGFTSSVTAYDFTFESCRCGSAFFGEGPEELLIFNELSGRFYFSEKIGIQFGLQRFNMKFKNSTILELVVDPISGAVSFVESTNLIVTAKKKFAEVPLNIVFRKEISQHLNFDLSVGIGVIFDLGYKSVTSDKRVSGEVIEKINRMRFDALSPQVKIDFAYSLGPRVEIKLGGLYKMREIDSTSKWIAGGGVGISYRLKKKKLN